MVETALQKGELVEILASSQPDQVPRVLLDPRYRYVEPKCASLLIFFCLAANSWVLSLGGFIKISH